MVERELFFWRFVNTVIETDIVKVPFASQRANRTLTHLERGTRSMPRIEQLVTLILAAIVAAACARGEAGSSTGEIAAVPVRVAEVVTDTVTVPIVATGTLGADEELTLGFKVGGVVARVGASPGDRVREGQTLAILETPEIDAAVSRADAAAEKAARDAARAKRLYEGGVISLRQMQDAETAERVARADLTSAAFNRRFSSIVAPSAGVVLERRKEPGELAAPGEPVLVLASGKRGYVLRVGLPDRDAVRVRRGAAARIRFDAYPGESFDGRVSEIGGAAQERTGTYTIEITLPSNPRLVTGLIGTAEIDAASGGRHPRVPVEALLEADGDRAIVFLLAPDGRTVERRHVRLTQVVGDRVAIVDGLDDAGTVVTDGAAYLRDGAQVEVVP
jgi:RND family efflux transporter MFP subunit